MRFSRLYLNRLLTPPAHADTVVVIDVLRSFTSAAVALANGAAAIHPVDGAAAAAALAARLPGALSIGAPEFDSSSPKKAIFDKLPTQPCGLEGDFSKKSCSGT